MCPLPYLTALADLARRTGYPVTEVAGWRTRGHGPQPQVQGVVCHHTAGASGGGDYPSLHIVRDGYSGLPGPLSHFGLGRSGRIYVIAAGRCYHNAPSTSPTHTNSASIGIEAENDGNQEWPAAQVDSYKRLCAEICREYGLPPSQVRAHREVNTQKPDPHSIDMTDFRADVARLLDGEPLEADMPKHVSLTARTLALEIPPGEWKYVPFTHRNGDPLPSTYYSVLSGPAFYDARVGVRFASADNPGLGTRAMALGTEVQMRLVEVVPDGDGYRIVESKPINSPVHIGGGGHFTHGWNGNAQDGHRVRFQVKHFAEESALLDFSSASILYWEK